MFGHEQSQWEGNYHGAHAYEGSDHPTSTWDGDSWDEWWDEEWEDDWGEGEDEEDEDTYPQIEGPTSGELDADSEEYWGQKGQRKCIEQYIGFRHH